MPDSITSETIENAIKQKFEDNQFLSQIKTCISQGQGQLFVLICQELERNLNFGELIYKFQTLRLCKLLVELRNDDFNNHFSINVLPAIVKMTSEENYTSLERSHRAELISICQLSKEVIRGWAHFFPGTTDADGQPVPSEFLKTYLQMLEKIEFASYEYYPLEIIQNHTHPNYQTFEKKWKEIQQLIDTNDVAPPQDGVEQNNAQKKLLVCQKLLICTQEQLNHLRTNYKALEEKTQQQKIEYAQLFQQHIELKSKKRHTVAAAPKDNIQVVLALETEKEHLNQEIMQLRTKNTELETRIGQTLGQMQQMKESFENQIQLKNKDIFSLKQQNQELNQNLLDQCSNQQLLSEQLKHFRESINNRSAETISLAQHKLEIQAKAKDYEFKLQTKETEIRNLEYQIKNLNEQKKRESSQKLQSNSELMQLNENYFKTITKLKQANNNLSTEKEQLEKQIERLNEKTTLEQYLLQQDLINQQKNHENKQKEYEAALQNLEKQCEDLKKKINQEKVFSAGSPSNGLKIQQTQHNIVDFNSIQNNYLISSKQNGVRSLNQSVQQSFRNTDFSCESPSPKNNVNFPEQFNFLSLSRNEISMNNSIQEKRLNLINGNGIFHTDNYFQFAKQQNIQVQMFQCKIYLKNINVSQIKGLKIKYTCSQSNNYSYLRQFIIVAFQDYKNKE